MTRFYSDFRDSAETNTFVLLTSTDSPDTASLSIEVPDVDGHPMEVYSHLTVFDAMLLREGLDAFIAEAVGSNV